MEPQKRAEILARVDAALNSFGPDVHHGQIVLHLGENDYEIEVSHRDRKKPLVDVPTKPKR